VCRERVRVVKHSGEVILGCVQQVILALQEVGGNPENPMRHALPRWLAWKGIADLKEQVVEFTRTDMIRTFCSDD
jgi:hypothetical protein